MTHRRLAIRQVLAVLVMVGPLVSVAVAGQSGTATTSPKRTTKTKPWTPSLAPDGHPDLQGVWNWAEGTPLERPIEMAGKAVLTADEFARAEQLTHDRANVDRRDAVGTDVDVGREYNEFWHTRRRTILTVRTSLITDPTDGKLPPLTEAAKQRRADDVAARSKRGPADSYEDRRLSERCLMHEENGPPILPGSIAVLVGREFLFQIFQTSDYVAILSEEPPQVRIIPLDGRPHLPPSIRQWVGDSRGHWEGTTLVVETTNLHLRRTVAGFPADKMHVVERFSRSAPDAIDYQFTVDDSTTWSEPWTAAVPIQKPQGRIYEFACHEGNYGLVNILTGARAEEKTAEDAAKVQR
jgi:hypothetical protein